MLHNLAALCCALTAPSLRAAPRPRMAPACMGAIPPAVSEAAGKFKSTYPDTLLQEQWDTLVDAYGGEDPAALAISRNPTVFNPAYTSPPGIISRSKEALVDVMGSEEEAIDVMLKNPAVLQCGASLRKQSPDEIKGFASMRQKLDQVPSEYVPYFIVFGALALVATIIDKNSGGAGFGADGVAAFASVSRPVLGAALGGVFLFTMYGSIKSQTK